MARTRTGARSYLELLRKVCKLFRHPGFTTGLINILGEAEGNGLIEAFLPVCAIVEVLLATDNYYNRVDTVAEFSGDEDITIT